MTGQGNRTEREAPRFRERNTPLYRLAHWPIWIFVFGIAPGPLTFNLFERGFDAPVTRWLGLVLLATATAAMRGRLPGAEPKPYIVRFTEDKPNPLYRRICYTAAWSNLITFTLLNLAGLTYAVVTGFWRLRQMYEYAYFPLAIVVWTLAVFRLLPRVRASTRGEGTERRYFYGAVWAVSSAHCVLGLLWKLLPQTRAMDAVKLAAFAGMLAGVGYLSYRGKLPRTRAVVAGEWAISD